MISNNLLPAIKIKEKALFKFNTYIKLAEGEVGGIGKIAIKDNEIIIEDIILLKQIASFGDFELTQDALNEFSIKQFQENPNSLGQFKLWWHKHPVTGWSGQDDSTFERLLQTFNGFVIGMVHQDVTKSGRFKPILFRMDFAKKHRYNMTINTKQYSIIKERFNKQKTHLQCKREFDELVSVRKIEVVKYYPRHPGCYPISEKQLELEREIAEYYFNGGKPPDFAGTINDGKTDEVGD